MTEKKYIITFTCLEPGPPPRERKKPPTITVYATNEEEAKEKAEPRMQEVCKTENPTGYKIISIHTRLGLKIMKEPIPGEPPQDK